MKKYGRYILCLFGLILWVSAVEVGIPRCLVTTARQPISSQENTPQEQLFSTADYVGLAGTVNTLRSLEHNVTASRTHIWEQGTTFYRMQVLRQHTRIASGILSECDTVLLQFTSTDVAYPFDGFW